MVPKVGRVEQMETPAMLKERNAKRRRQGKRSDKAVLRKMIQVVSQGTITNSEWFTGEDAKDASYLLALCARPEYCIWPEGVTRTLC